MKKTYLARRTPDMAEREITAEQARERHCLEKYGTTCAVHRTREYSKRMLTGLVAAWFIGMVYGMVFCLLQWRVTPDNTSIGELLTYIGAPMSCGVVGYLVKSAMENRIKLQKTRSHIDGGDTDVTEL